MHVCFNPAVDCHNPIKCVILAAEASNDVGTNFGVGGRRGKARRAESGEWGSWEGTASPSPLTRRFAERCKLSQRVRGGAPVAEGFSCILSRQIAFPSISVRVAYSLHG